jgi:Co/Zn/Cd efflux system component
MIQLNDIISLAVGLWAVKAAQRPSTDKFSFGVSSANPAKMDNGY